MGLFSFFKRRADRESAIPQSQIDEVTGAAPKPAPAPVGQQFDTVGQQPINLSLGSGAVDVAGVLGMIGKAMSSGNFQVQQGDSQVIDLRGSGLREEIMKAMQESGVDPDAAEGQQVNAGDYTGLQEQIVKTLEAHGVDLSQVDPQYLPSADQSDPDGDGSR